jgi:hypothetical protein
MMAILWKWHAESSIGVDPSSVSPTSAI